MNTTNSNNNTTPPPLPLVFPVECLREAVSSLSEDIKGGVYAATVRRGDVGGGKEEVNFKLQFKKEKGSAP